MCLTNCMTSDFPCLVVHACLISVHVSFASWFSAAQFFPRLKGGASHTYTVGQHGWRQLRGRLSKYGQNWSGTFPSSALRCVYLCVCVYLCLHRFSGEAQQVLTGPSSSLHSPYKPCFFVCMLCVYASRLDLLCVGLMLKWLTAQQSQGRLREFVGREGPYSLTAFSPEG